MGIRDKGKVKVIRAQSDARQWLPPDVSGPQRTGPGGAAAGPAPAPPTAAQLHALQEQARAEGYEAGRREGMQYGHNEGLEEGRAKVRGALQSLDSLMQALDNPFQHLDDSVESEIVTLVISMVRQLVRREIKLDPRHIVGVVREALAILPVNSRNVRVNLHPDDAGLIRAAYAMGEAEQSWSIVEDPVVQRGGCRVVTETSQVDATLASRLNALIAPLLAAERQRDPGDAQEQDDAAHT